MIMRVLYLVVIATGIGMIFSVNYSGLIAPLTTKVVLAIVLIGLMEMTIPKMKRGLFWILSFVIFGVILYLGYNVLPLTF